MSQESLTPVPLNSDTIQQHVVVRGDVVEHTTDDHGFMESTLRSQNGETSVESRKSRHKREIVESIDPQNVHLEGATVTLAQMIIARELVHSEEFAAHEPDERDEIISGLLDQLMSDDDESESVYYKHRLKLAAMLMQPEAKFEKTQRKYELYQARRDEVKLQRPGKHEKSIESLDEHDTLEEEAVSANETTPASARSLQREIKKCDREYLGIVGEIAETRTPVDYLESKYAEFIVMTGPDNYEINDRNRASAQREAIRKLVQRAVTAKGVEGEEKQAYEDHLVSVFHDYVSLSDADREGLHESLSARYQKAQELRALSKTSVAEEAEHSSLAERMKARLSSRLGGRAVAAALKRRWIDGASDSKNVDTHEDEVDGQLALFSDEAYQVDGKKGRIKRGSEWLQDGAWAMISRNQARWVHKHQMEQTRLDNLSDEERAVERQKKNDRKTGVMLALGGAAALAVSFYYMKYGLDNPFNGIGSDRVRAGSGDGQTGGLADLLNPPTDSNAQEVVPGTELNPQSSGGDFPRSELFEGRGGSRSPSAQNIESLNGFLSDYKVKGGDDRGVWGISEKYLESQGVNNPTVFETDAVKDYILQHSSLTNSSIIYPGDTIKLK